MENKEKNKLIKNPQAFILTTIIVIAVIAIGYSLANPKKFSPPLPAPHEVPINSHIAVAPKVEMRALSASETAEMAHLTIKSESNQMNVVAASEVFGVVLEQQENEQNDELVSVTSYDTELPSLEGISLKSDEESANDPARLKMSVFVLDNEDENPQNPFAKKKDPTEGKELFVIADPNKQ